MLKIHLSIKFGLLNVSQEAAYLNESDILRLLPETLTADVKAVLADHTSSVSTDAAMQENISLALV